MKTRRELNLEYWGRIHDMCDAHNVKSSFDNKIAPQDCVKIAGNLYSKYSDHSKHPIFASDPDDCQLAVGIVDNTPVFPGDKIYTKITGQEITVTEGFLSAIDYTLTRPKPKREFEINGKMLPCPIDDFNGCRLDFLCFDYFFGSIEDRNKVAQAIKDLLDNARDKG